MPHSQVIPFPSESAGAVDSAPDARVAIERGNRLRDGGRLDAAFAAYADAISRLESAVRENPSDPRRRDHLASAWANLGLAWRSSAKPDGPVRALAAFDSAIRLREPLLGIDHPWLRYNLAGVWINRADMLQELAGEQPADDALAAYARALEILAPMRDDRRPRVRQRVALARVNYAGVLLAKGDRAAAEAALRVIGAISDDPPIGLEDTGARVIRASAGAVRAQAFIRLESWEAAEEAARQALQVLGPIDRAESAVIALRVRTLLCLCLLRQEWSDSARARLDEAADCAEEGLDLAARWRSAPGVARAIPELFRVALDGYARRQPHFVAEFLDEHLALAEAAAPREARAAASEAVAVALGGATGRAFRARDSAEAEAALNTFSALRRMAERLAS